MGERTLLIRVDGGRRTGLGHMMRCLQLCRSLDDHGVDTMLLMRERSELRGILASETRTIVALPPDADEENAVAFAKDIISTLGGDALLIDLPCNLTEEEYSAFASTGLPLVLLDDHGPAAGKADAVINAIAHSDHLAATPGSDSIYIGAEYIIIDPAFARTEAAISPAVQRLLIAMGGSDPFGITPRVLRALLQLPNEIELNALLGPAYADADGLRRDMEKSGRDVVLAQAVENMPEYVAGFDLAVLSFGITAYGAAALGVPSILIGHDDPGVAAARAFSELYGCAVSMGHQKDLDVERLFEEVEKLIADGERRLEMSRKGRAAVDGRGLERVTRIILDLVR